MIKISIANVESSFKELERKMLLEISSSREATARALLEDLRSSTPVDTGNARDSWNLEKTNAGFDITNSAEYIEHLNNGSSKQAPSHFIEKTALNYGTPVGAIVEMK